MALTPIFDVTDATSTQLSAQFNRQQGSKSMLVTLDVTAGSTLSLTFQIYIVAATAPVIYAEDGAAVTGVGTRQILVTEHVATGVGSGVDSVLRVPIPETLHVAVSHGNANAATYTLTVDFQ